MLQFLYFRFKNLKSINNAMSSNGNFILVVTNWSDSGEYRCQAENHLGMVFAVTRIIVLGI